MKIKLARARCMELMRKYGLYKEERPWKLRFVNKEYIIKQEIAWRFPKDRALWSGQCSPGERKIELCYEDMRDFSWEQVRHTILHEIGHALLRRHRAVNYISGKCIHGFWETHNCKEWQAICKELKIPPRAYTLPFKYVVKCSCGKKNERNRVRKNYSYKCWKCGSPIYFSK